MGHCPCEPGLQHHSGVLGANCWGWGAEGGNSGTGQGFSRLFVCSAVVCISQQWNAHGKEDASGIVVMTAW